MARTHGECRRHAATIDALTDNVFLEIFAFCICYRDQDCIQPTWEWQRLVHVCQRWRRIIYASPRYLDLVLYCSNRAHIRNLSCWPAFPISIISRIPDDIITLLKHRDRVRSVYLAITGLQYEKVLTAMKEPFPVLTYFRIHVRPPTRLLPVLPGGFKFLGGSAPCLRQILLSGIPFVELPILLLSSRDLVFLEFDSGRAGDYTSSELVAVLSVLTRLETLHMAFPHTVRGQWTRHPDPPIRAVLPALTEFDFFGIDEHLEDLVAQLDAPLLGDVQVELGALTSLPLPQLSLFITGTENLRPTHAQVEFSRGGFIIKIKFGQFDRAHGERALHLSLWIEFGWMGANMVHQFSQNFAMFPDVGHLFVSSTVYYPRQQNYIDDCIDWLESLRIFTTLKTLHIHGNLAWRFSHALENIPGEAVTEVLPSLQSLLLDDDEGLVEGTKQFASLRQLYGRPVTIIDKQAEGLESPCLARPYLGWGLYK